MTPRVLALLLLLGLTRPAYAQVALDAKFEKSATSQNSPFSYVSNAGTVAGTVGSTATVLIAAGKLEASPTPRATRAALN